jgi:hypothetical protein
MTVTVNKVNGDYVETAPELVVALLVEHHGLARALSFCYQSPPIFVSAPPTHKFLTLEPQRIVPGITPLGIS